MNGKAVVTTIQNHFVNRLAKKVAATVKSGQVGCVDEIGSQNLSLLIPTQSCTENFLAL